MVYKNDFRYENDCLYYMTRVTQGVRQRHFHFMVMGFEWTSWIWITRGVYIQETRVHPSQLYVDIYIY